MDNFYARRQLLMQQLDNDSVVIIVGNCAKTRSKNINYHFRPDNDLYYLTGFTEPNAVAVLRPEHELEFVLFVRENNAAAETSFGARAGLEGAKVNFQANDAFSIADIHQQLPRLLEQRHKVYLLDEQEFYSEHVSAWLHQQRRTTGFDIPKVYRQLLPLQPLIHNARVIKSDDEVALIRHAVQASIHGHKAMMQQCRPMMNELQLQAIFDREIANFGCRAVAYPSIVAGGNNGCCLHYEENNSTLNNGDLVLIDAGAEYQQYCSDITRTWPINGKFTEPQQQIYQLVLAAIDAAIAKVKPGLVWNEIYQTCMQVLAQGLIELGIISGSFDEVMQSESYRQFTVHKTGHWLGMDVHDVGSYHEDSRYHESNSHWRLLEENMVFTIEPGLYFPSDCLDVAEQWRGIAIRIEDDILVTATGHENLSAAIPRTLDEIEAFMQSL